MEVPCILHVRVDYLLKYFFFQCTGERLCELFFYSWYSKFFGVGKLFLVIIILIAIVTYVESLYVCCFGLIDDDFANVSQSRGVKKGGSQVNFTARPRQPPIQQGNPELVDIGITRFNRRFSKNINLSI